MILQFSVNDVYIIHIKTTSVCIGEWTMDREQEVFGKRGKTAIALQIESETQ